MQLITKGKREGMFRHILIPNPESIKSPALYNEVIKSLKYSQMEPYTVLEDQDEAMQTLIKRDKLHLHQAFDTTFPTEVMQNYIGRFGVGKGAQDILDRNFDPNVQENLPAVHYWIKHHLRQVVDMDSININPSVDKLRHRKRKFSVLF
eukprot:14255245-Ditylum_brightwellii.AAC.1